MASFNSNVGGLSLCELFPKAKFIGVSDIRVQGCCADWKQCQPGDLYVAMESPDGDGHDHIDGAIENGASAVLAERYLITDVPVCVVEDARETYGKICQQLAGDPTRDISVIGVTGTNGKTSTAHLLRSVLREAGISCGLISSLEVEDGFQRKPSTADAPGSPRLAQDLARMSMNGCTHAIVEISSKALAQKQLAGVELDAAVITNIRQDHLDFHGSPSNYRDAKKQVLELLSLEGVAVLNADDATIHSLIDELSCPTITVGVQQAAEISATMLESFGSEQTFLIHAGNDTIPVRTSMIGDHHLRNCLSATGMALVMGIDLTTIARGLESVTRLPGRLERVECGQPFGVFVDYARTPDQLASSLKALRTNYSGDIYCVFGTGAEDAVYHSPWIGKLLERSCDYPIITGANESPSQSLKKAHLLLDGFDRPAKAHLMPDREAAIEFALERARPNDCVLIAGQGEKPSCRHPDNAFPMFDRQICEQWLYDVGAKKEYAEASAPGKAMTYRIQDFQS